MRVSKLMFLPDTIQSKTARAMGSRSGDWLKIENKWAYVTITHQPYEDDSPDIYVVTEASRTSVDTWAFSGAGAALQYALTRLIGYEEGRAD